MARKPLITVAFQRDMRKEGWELIEDSREPWPILATKIELVPFLEKGEGYIGGEELVRRARGELRANLAQRHAEWLLEHQDKIPEEFRQFVLVFPGTVWRGDNGRRLVAYLYWRDERWNLRFGWLADDFRGLDRLVRPREG